MPAAKSARVSLPVPAAKSRTLACGESPARRLNHSTASDAYEGR